MAAVAICYPCSYHIHDRKYADSLLLSSSLTLFFEYSCPAASVICHVWGQQKDCNSSDMHVPCINCCRDYFGRFRSSSRYMLVFILIGSQWILISHWIDVVLSLPSAKICFTAKRSKPYFVALWVPVLSFEFILCGLAIIKGIRTLRKDSQTGGWSCGKTLNVLIKDSILYFIA